MADHNNEEVSIIPISSNKLVRVEGSISITNKIIKEHDNRPSESNQTVYPGITIGSQFWMTENLNVDVFRNGELIPEAKTDDEWVKAGENEQAAWCYYNNDIANGKNHGKLYNWYAVNDPRGLAPKGWHVPTDEEWRILADFLGGQHEAGYKMKSESGWKEGGNGTNESCFSGLPTHFRDDEGWFWGANLHSAWWSSTEYTVTRAWTRTLYLNESKTETVGQIKRWGSPVRCLRD